MRLTVYIPTYGRRAACLEQVQRLHHARLISARGWTVTIVVSVNGDAAYSESELREAGADVIHIRPVNLGGGANYCLAFENLSDCDYLWVVSDDDPVQEEALARVSRAIDQSDSPDLVVIGGTHAPTFVTEPGCIDEVAHLPIASISCSVFRSDTFTGLIPYAFAGIVTHFPQVALIRAGIHSGRMTRIAVIPTDGVVDLSAFGRDQTQLGRGGMGTRTGAFFFGGGLLVYLEDDEGMRKVLARQWWRQNWHRLSMYRLANSGPRHIVDAMGRSSLFTVGWWLVSLPSWWRVKDRLDNTRRHRRLAKGS